MGGIFDLFKGFSSSTKRATNSSSSSNKFNTSKQTSTHTDAIASIRETVEILQKKADDIEQKIQLEYNKAKAYVSTNKNAALIALKKKKALETQLASIHGSIMRMEEQALQLETVIINEETRKVLSKSLEAQKCIQSQVAIEDIETVVDDLREFRDRQRDYDAALQSLDDNEYEDTINNEFESLMQEKFSEEIISKMPPLSVPRKDYSRQQLQENAFSASKMNGSKSLVSSNFNNEDEDERELEELRKALAL